MTHFSEAHALEIAGGDTRGERGDGPSVGDAAPGQDDHRSHRQGIRFPRLSIYFDRAGSGETDGGAVQGAGIPAL